MHGTRKNNDKEIFCCLSIYVFVSGLQKMNLDG